MKKVEELESNLDSELNTMLMIEIRKEPEYTWRCEVMTELYWYREEGQQPNAFHRMMQRLVFGIKWEKLE